ncbi:uncharacterized protein LOC133778856 [Humulus lupulus]|uniref:uncharacterized protein LOC133778856 n=1 Tax=Humulus lupulus TaxID=3486 RepID=UPI002B415D0A|nr:uncharacterized protein LOC133778856 [Humulus lupulus]
MSSGLQPNDSKTAIYCCCMEDTEIRRVLDASGFIRSEMPFKYLGILICARRLSALECEVLVEKIVQKIRVWGSRNISFAGRMTLINSVLISIHSYWAQIMIIPKRVLKKINAIFWNTAAIAKYVWAISSKQDNLWVRWIHSVYLKNENCWDYISPTNGSWYWKKIVRIKEKYKLLTNFQVLMTGKYSVQKGYKMLCEEQEKVPWHREVWNRYNVPKHSFITWLAIQNRLQTKDMLFSFNICQDTDCFFCGAAVETVTHLFLECDFSSRCLLEIKQWLDWKVRNRPLLELLRCISRAKLQRFKKQVLRT